jgi:hypothetical protein
LLQKPVDCSKELIGSEGFVEEDRAQGRKLAAAQLILLARCDENGGARDTFGRGGFEELEAVETREIHVDDQQIGRAPRESVEQCLPRAEETRVESGVSKHALERQAHRRVIVDHAYERKLRHGTNSLRPARAAEIGP